VLSIEHAFFISGLCVETTMQQSLWIRWCVLLVVLGLFVLVWFALIRWFKIPSLLLPSPAEVLTAIFRERRSLSLGFGITAAVAFFALAISLLVGTLIAIIFSFSSLLRTTFYPYVIFLQTVPIVAIAPLLITWFGYGFQTIVLIAVIISLFPIISNVTTGLISVPINLVELFQLNGASRWQTLWRLRIPFAVRHMIMGARISAGMAVIGAIIGEFFVGESSTSATGLGTLIAGWQRTLRMDAMIAAIIASTALGIMILGSVNLISRHLLGRWTEGQFENSSA
jgi:NitT/TauT family transport system permease protein